MNWKLSLIVLLAMPVLIYATDIFQKKMKVAFNEVRNEVANLNTFVQERLTGMKIENCLIERRSRKKKKKKKKNLKNQSKSTTKLG